MNFVADKAQHRGGVSADQLVGAGCDSLEYRLNVRWRTGNDIQDIGGCSLPFQRFPCVVEEPHILDGDHRLVGEGLEQLDVMIGECSGLRPRDTNDADGFSLTHQGREQ